MTTAELKSTKLSVVEKYRERREHVIGAKMAI